MGTSTITESIKSARKAHSCSWCGQEIGTGHPYNRYRYYDGSDASTVKMHPECMRACDELVAEQGGEVEFYPGDNPRGCHCGFCKECKNCNDRLKALDELTALSQEIGMGY